MRERRKGERRGRGTEENNLISWVTEQLAHFKFNFPQSIGDFVISNFCFKPSTIFLREKLPRTIKWITI